jgi:glutamate racemase
LLAQACPKLVPLIEGGAPESDLTAAVKAYVDALLQNAKTPPEYAILGCTHYPLVAHHFRAALPPQTRLLNQPQAVANALEDYFSRHADVTNGEHAGLIQYFTSGDAQDVSRIATRFLGVPGGAVRFGQL